MGAIINHCLVLFALCLLAHVASSAPAEHPEVESSVDLEVRGYRQSMFSLIIAISLLCSQQKLWNYPNDVYINVYLGCEDESADLCKDGMLTEEDDDGFKMCDELWFSVSCPKTCGKCPKWYVKVQINIIHMY